MVAAIREPERVRALVMLDPTILPRPFLWAIRLAYMLGKRPSRGNAERAELRRYTFDSYKEAFDYWRPKKLFSDWSDVALRAYVDTLVPDGDKLTLAWPREWEAYIFRTMHTGVWRDVAALSRTQIPTLIVCGGTSDTYVSGAQRGVEKLLPHATHITLADYGHLFPHAAPDQAAQIVGDWLRRSGNF